MKESNSNTDIMNEGNINLNEKEDNITNVSRIFDNEIRPLNNSVNISNPYHLYDQLEFPLGISISEKDNSAGIFSCESIIDQMNKSTPTSISSIQIFDLKEENVEGNNNNEVIIPNEILNYTANKVQNIPLFNNQSKYIIF